MTDYVHCRWANGSHQMVPAASAPVLAEAGRLEIVDPTPGPYAPIVSGADVVPADSDEPDRPKRSKATRVVTEPAPIGASVPEEASE